MNLASRLWRIYLFVTISSVLGLVVLGIFAWGKVKQEADTELRYLNEVSFNATRAMLDYQKSIFQMFAYELLEHELDGDLGELNITLDMIVKNNPDIANFIVRDPEGEILLSDGYVGDIDNFSAMLKHPVTQYNLQRTLAKGGLIIGSNRYIAPINTQVIGVHYGVEKNGKVIAILTSAIRHNINRSAWNNSRLTGGTILQVFRDDYYFIYSSRAQYEGQPAEYLKPISSEVVNLFTQKMHQQTGVSVDALQTNRELVSVNALFAPGMDAMFTIQYEPEYRYYTLTSVERASLYREFLPTLIWQLVFVLAFNLLLFLFFRLFNKEQNEADSRLVFQANHDQLTGLPNRYFLASHFDEWVRSCNGRFSIFFIDLDNFKIINDNYGHLTGDKILVDIARRIEQQFKSLIIRHGGDEFIIFSLEHNEVELIKQAKKFINYLMQPITVDHIDFSVTSSIGIVRAPENGTELGVLLSKADIAMYEAKKHRNEAFLFSDELEKRSAYVTAIEKELRFAVEHKELFMVYQPQVSVNPRRVIGVEALVRWHNKALGVVPPCDFIPIAENMGLMNQLGQFITSQAIEEINDVCREFGPIRLSINVSVQQLLTEGFFEFFQAEIERHSNQHLSLMIEVTESMFIEDLKLAIYVLQQFSDIGVGISLDDFGTGFSSLSLLANLPIHELKIDKSFVEKILTDGKAKHLVHSIITIGKDLDLSTIAEGVEEREQLVILEDFGCQLQQGYYFSEPLGKAELMAFLAQAQELAPGGK